MREKDKEFYLDASTTTDDIQQKITETGESCSNAYGFSKACVNLYTLQMAKANPDVVITSCTPGFIDTDLTAGMGATGTPVNFSF